MQRYESYKPSGAKWIGDVPAHWDIRPGFTCFDENKDRNKKLTEKTVLSLSYGRIVVKSEEKMTGLVPESFDTYQLIKPGDIVIRTTDLQNDKTSLRVGLAKDKGMITSAYLGLRCKPDIHPEYIFRLLESYDALKVFYGMGSGLRQNIDFWDFKRLPVPLPPRVEQDRIVTFLNQKASEIDSAIFKKERLIELLHEQKAILINKAVTEGLDPTAPLMDSGLEWLGKIPAHWKLEKVKSLFRLVIDPAPSNNDYELLSIYTDIGVRPRKDLKQKGNRASTTDGYWKVQKGDFIVNKLLAWMGAIGLSNYAGVTSPAYDILRPRRELDGSYYHYLFRTKKCSSELKRWSRELWRCGYACTLKILGHSVSRIHHSKNNARSLAGC